MALALGKLSRWAVRATRISDREPSGCGYRNHTRRVTVDLKIRYSLVWTCVLLRYPNRKTSDDRCTRDDQCNHPCPRLAQQHVNPHHGHEHPDFRAPLSWLDTHRLKSGPLNTPSQLAVNANAEIIIVLRYLSPCIDKTPQLTKGWPR
jgi:hypothetical protein